MPGPLSRAKQLHRLADENLRLAEAASTQDGRDHHRTIAEQCLLMAEAELKAASKRIARQQDS
jgi:hypothetical protein